MAKINIAGLAKEKVLAALYNNACSPGLGALQRSSKNMTEEEAKKIISESGTNFDYLGGRVLKINIGSDEIDPWLYDRDNGQDAAKKAIDAIR